MLLLLCADLTAQAALPSVKTFIDFSLKASSANECILFSPTVQPTAVKLYKSPKLSADVVAQIDGGTHCRILSSKQKKDAVWYEIMLPSEESLKSKKTAWARFDQVVTVKSVHPIGGGRDVILTFRPPCEEEPCQRTAWLVRATQQREMEIGDGIFAVDAKGENIFYEQITKEEIDSNRAAWQALIYRYNVAQNSQQKIAQGLAPSVSPKKDILYFRNFKGQVMASDFSGRAVQILYTPPDPIRLYVDAQGVGTPISDNDTDFPWGGTVTGPVRLYIHPEDKALPSPVQFVGTAKIRFQTPYAEGKVRATVTLDAAP